MNCMFGMSSVKPVEESHFKSNAVVLAFPGVFYTTLYCFSVAFQREILFLFHYIYLWNISEHTHTRWSVPCPSTFDPQSPLNLTGIVQGLLEEAGPSTVSPNYSGISISAWCQDYQQCPQIACSSPKTWLCSGCAPIYACISRLLKFESLTI